jgi:hypothetical protein
MEIYFDFLEYVCVYISKYTRHFGTGSLCVFRKKEKYKNLITATDGGYEYKGIYVAK